MLTRGPFARLLLGVGILSGLGLALAGGVVLRGSGVVAVVLAGGVAACLAAGVARETSGPSRISPWEAAGLAGGWTIAGLLVLAGTAAVAGGLAAVLLGAAGGLVGLAVWLLRAHRSERESSSGPAAARPANPAPVLPTRPVAATPGHTATAGVARLTLPVSLLSTDALGREWLRTTSALAGWLDPAARESIVRRRQEALDELERRDPEGFARWLAAGPAPGSDPADYVQGGPPSGRD
ncbi:hypothetical protein ACI797_00080 [Geodermatophilus sp. SYSU D00691]